MIRTLGAGLLAVLALGAAGWQRADPLPVARSEVAAARYGNGIVIVGGYVAGGTGNTARADLFLPGQNRWRRLPDYPLPIDHAAGVGAGPDAGTPRIPRPSSGGMDAGLGRVDALRLEPRRFPRVPAALR